MTSAALVTWKTGRASRLDRLEAAHAAVYGTGDGGRRLAGGLNRALILQLAAEFQGFARDLHDEARYALVGELAAGDGQRQLVLLNEARNGLAHADDQKTARVAATGWLLTLRSARRWRGTLNGLAIGMDSVGGEHLRRNLGVRAW